MAISTLYPSSRPSLSLDFAKSKRLDPRIAFSRTHTGSIASYTDSNGLIRFAGPDAPRFDHDPTTGESLGLLVEEERTNIFNWSESFLSGQGFGGNGTLNSDTIINPTGSLGTVHYITTSEWYKTFDANQATSLAISFFSKKRLGGLNNDFNTFEFYQVATAGGSMGFYSFRYDGDNSDTTLVKNVKTTSLPNGWYRFEFQLLPRADYNNGVFSTSTRIDMEGAASDNYIWGIQVEKDKAFCTSYIPTTTAAVTRPADIVSIRDLKDSDWWDKQVDSFSMVIEWDSPVTLDPATHGLVLGYLSFWSDSTNFDNRIGIPLPHTNSTTALTRSFGSGDAIFNNGTFTASSQDEFKKMSFRYSIPDYSDHTTKVWKIYYNSGDTSYTVAGNSNGTTVPDINRLGIGNNPSRFDESPGVKTFKKLSIYNTVLPDNQLQTLTK